MWTKEQEQAIRRRGNVLVAAAAGSGKTAVLVERIIRRITDQHQPVDVNRLLVVTFTKAAANEMLERIRKGLTAALFMAQDPVQADRLLHQLALLEHAHVCNLHSFCLELVRRHFYLLGLDPTFRVADPAEVGMLRQDVVDELLEGCYAANDPGFLAVADVFAGDRSDWRLQDLVLRLYEFASSQVDPREWLTRLPAAYCWDDAEALAASPWGRSVKERIRDGLAAVKSELEGAAQLAGLPDGPTPYLACLEEDLNQIAELNACLEQLGWAELAEKFAEVKFSRLPAIRSEGGTEGSSGGPDPAEASRGKAESGREQVKARRGRAKDKFKAIYREFFATPLTAWLPYLRRMGSVADGLVKLTVAFSEAYAATKRRRNVIDFADMEHLALHLLADENEPSEVAWRLREQFVEVLVDEYQDINPVQERILQLVARPSDGSGNLFMVGDMKQSIYRFRMADPGLFLAKYQNWPHWPFGTKEDMSGLLPCEGGSGMTGLVIDLTTNFRSRPEIIHGVNFLFGQLMTPGSGEISYDARAALRCGAVFAPHAPAEASAAGPIEVHLIDLAAVGLATGKEGDAGGDIAGSCEGPDTPEEAIDPAELMGVRQEARLVARRIQDLLHQRCQVYDTKLQSYRQLTYADIVVLMRSCQDVTPIYLEEFSRAGIPLFAESREGYFSAGEVETVLALLQVIDNPHQDIPLVAVLRSPFVGLNGQELGLLRILEPAADFYELLALAVWASRRLASASPGGPEKVDSEGSAELSGYEEFQEILGMYRDNWAVMLGRAQAELARVPEFSGKVMDFWAKLKVWRNAANRLSLADLIWQIYEQTDYLSYVGMLPGGRQRQANLRLLYERARSFETSRFRGLFRFLRFVEKFRGQGNDLGGARALGEGENVVRILTVHGSKGLEFPVVFLTGLGRGFNRQDERALVLLNAQLGLGLPVIDAEHQVRYPSFIKSSIQQRLFQEAMAEEMRVLYVALTRAKEKLILCGSSKDLGAAVEKWRQIAACRGRTFADPVLRGARCYLDWVMPALLRHPAIEWPDELGPSAGTQCLFRAGEAVFAQDEPSRWKICWHPVLLEPEERSLEQEQRPLYSDTSDLQLVDRIYLELDRRLRWIYPFQDDVVQPAKTSVSRLKEQSLKTLVTASELRAFGEGVAAPRGLFAAGVKAWAPVDSAQLGLSAAERGTAMHVVMQHVPFADWAAEWSELSHTDQQAKVAGLLARLVNREILRPEQQAVIDQSAVIGLLNSELGQRFFSAKQLWREVPFTLALSRATGSPVLVQGIIDALLFHGASGPVEVVDYKTDGGVDPDTLYHRYAVQLALYALAVERLLKTKVALCTLYSFSLGKTVNFEAAQRGEVLGQVLQQAGFLLPPDLLGDCG